MFNRDEWSEILKNSYGLRSEKIEGVWLFETRRGMEMNIVGDYIEMPSKRFFEKAKGEVRIDAKPVSGDAAQNFETYRLDVSSSYEKILREKIHQKSRNLINKAEKCGVKTRIANSEEELWDYYKMYVSSMLGIGAIPQSFVLFKEMRKAFGKDFMLFISSVSNDSKVGKDLAGIIALRNGKMLHIWSNGQFPKAKMYSANMGCYAAVIKFACEDPNIEELDFGNSEPESSLAFFKSRFGAKRIPVWSVSTVAESTEFKKKNNSSLQTIQNGRFRHKKIMSIGVKLLGFLPVPVLSMASRILFKYLR